MEQNTVGRHTLLVLNRAGREAAAQSVQPLYPQWSTGEAAALVRSGVPAIVARQVGPVVAGWQVGFSGPEKRDGARLRASALVPFEGVEYTLQPHAVLAGFDPPPALAGPLALLAQTARACGLRLGVYGSLALQMVTGRAYFNAASDIDLYATALHSKPDMTAFYGACAESPLRLDVEVEVAGGYGVKLAELCAGRPTVLGKGLYEVKLLNTKQVFGKE